MRSSLPVLGLLALAACEQVTVPASVDLELTLPPLPPAIEEPTDFSVATGPQDLSELSAELEAVIGVEAQASLLSVSLRAADQERYSKIGQQVQHLSMYLSEADTPQPEDRILGEYRDIASGVRLLSFDGNIPLDEPLGVLVEGTLRPTDRDEPLDIILTFNFVVQLEADQDLIERLQDL